jgi:hypothetical protein
LRPHTAPATQGDGIPPIPAQRQTLQCSPTRRVRHVREGSRGWIIVPKMLSQRREAFQRPTIPAFQCPERADTRAVRRVDQSVFMARRRPCSRLCCMSESSDPTQHHMPHFCLSTATMVGCTTCRIWQGVMFSQYSWRMKADETTALIICRNVLVESIAGVLCETLQRACRCIRREPESEARTVQHATGQPRPSAIANSLPRPWFNMTQLNPTSRKAHYLSPPHQHRSGTRRLSRHPCPDVPKLLGSLAVEHLRSL